MGVWIETNDAFCNRSCIEVTPYVGVWIETRYSLILLTVYRVTPYVGVWIETVCFGGFAGY